MPEQIEVKRLAIHKKSLSGVYWLALSVRLVIYMRMYTIYSVDKVNNNFTFIF